MGGILLQPLGDSWHDVAQSRIRARKPTDGLSSALCHLTALLLGPDVAKHLLPSVSNHLLDLQNIITHTGSQVCLVMIVHI